MGIGIFNKIKNGLRNLGSKIVNAIPKVVDVGKKIIDKVKPIASMIPGVGGFVDTIDKGLDIAGKVGNVLRPSEAASARSVGRSLIGDVS